MCRRKPTWGTRTVYEAWQLPFSVPTRLLSTSIRMKNVLFEQEAIKARTSPLEEEENYKEALAAAFKVWSPPSVSSDLRTVLDDRAAEALDAKSPIFWILVRLPTYRTRFSWDPKEGGGPVGLVALLSSSLLETVDLHCPKSPVFSILVSRKSYEVLREFFSLSLNKATPRILLRIRTFEM